MQYMGSKNRLCKEIVPIIQSYVNNSNGYLEPFVGGANVIDKIKCNNKYGCDLNKYLIELLIHIQKTTEDLPITLLEEEYKKIKNNQENYEDWYLGLISFCSFGNKMWNGYLKNNSQDVEGKRAKSYFDNLRKQAPNLKDIHFDCRDFRDINANISNFVIYCDPPYRGTTKYKTAEFPYEEFYQWCRKMAKNNIVLVSEYNMPNDFECIWSKETIANFDSNRKVNDDKKQKSRKIIHI